MIQFRFYKLYIKGTPHKGYVTSVRDSLCKIKPSIRNILGVYSSFTDLQVYLTTKSLKHIHDRHIYDKKNYQDFMVILQNLTKIIRYPDEVRRDVASKRGDFLFVKKIHHQLYFASLEVIEDGSIEVVSCSATGMRYLEKFTLLWSWGTANPPS